MSIAHRHYGRLSSLPELGAKVDNPPIPSPTLPRPEAVIDSCAAHPPSYALPCSRTHTTSSQVVGKVVT